MRIRAFSMALLALLVSGCAWWGPTKAIPVDVVGSDGEDPATIDIGTTDTINPIE